MYAWGVVDAYDSPTGKEELAKLSAQLNQGNDAGQS